MNATTTITTTPVRPWLLAHDGSSAALQALAQQQLGATPVQSLDATPAAGEHWLVLCDAWRVHDALALQQRALDAGAAVLFVLLEPGSVQFGPFVDGAVTQGHRGCLGCQKLWLSHNLHQPAHWCAATATPGALRLASQAPLAPAAQAVFAQLLAQALAAPQALAGATRRLQWERLTSSTHRFLPHPQCAHGHALPGDSAERAAIAWQPRPLAPGATRVPNPQLSPNALRQAFLDRRTGIVKHVFQDLSSELMPMAAAEMALTRGDGTEVGYGRNEGRETSEMVAMLEVLERFCGHEPRRHAPGVRGSFEDVARRHPGAVVDPRDFVLHGAEQLDAPGYRYEPYSEALELDWSWGHSMRHDKPVLVPQQMVYYRLPDTRQRPVNRFVYDSSSGCALGGCLEEAVLYGLFEVLERDAYLTAWYGRIAPRAIALDAVQDPRVQALLARSRAQGFEVHAFDMRLDVDVPLVWALIVDPRDDAPVKSYCASAGHFRWEQALFSALVEVTTSIGVYQRSLPLQRERALQLAADPHAVQKMTDHVLLYSLPQTWPRLQFLFDGQPPVLPDAAAASTPADLRVELQHRAAQALAVASDLIVVNQTYAPMEAMGLHCVKVLAPGLTPVTFGHQHRRVSLARVNAARAARGLAAITAAQINPDPHNFP